MADEKKQDVSQPGQGTAPAGAAVRPTSGVGSPTRAEADKKLEKDGVKKEEGEGKEGKSEGGQKARAVPDPNRGSFLESAPAPAAMPSTVPGGTAYGNTMTGYKGGRS